MTDLTAAIEAAVAAEAALVPHADWCCSKGCARMHHEAGPPVDDGDPDVPFMTPTVRRLGYCSGTEADCGCERREILGHVRHAVEAAAPLIEADVREQIEAGVADLEHTRDEVRLRVADGYSVDWSSGYDDAVGDAVKVARGDR